MLCDAGLSNGSGECAPRAKASRLSFAAERAVGHIRGRGPALNDQMGKQDEAVSG